MVSTIYLLLITLTGSVGMALLATDQAAAQVKSAAPTITVYQDPG